SIENAHRFYNACRKQLGEDNPMTGYAAKNLGGCYFNSRRNKESIPWYRLGLELMLRSGMRSEEHTSELQSRFDLVCRLLLEKQKLSVDIDTFAESVLPD